MPTSWRPTFTKKHRKAGGWWFTMQVPEHKMMSSKSNLVLKSCIDLA